MPTIDNFVILADIFGVDKKEMRASCLAEIARALYTTPDYLLGFEEEKDPFEKEALCILQGIKDDTVREMLEKVPDDYEVIFELTERSEGESKTSIAFINGFRVEDEYREVRLMN